VIFDLSDEGQQRAFAAERDRQALRYGCTYILPLSRSRVLLIEPWDSRTAVR
jgi:hypothetical protein